MAIVPFSFFSGALYARKVCQVYVPEGYREAEHKRYPVVYLLHGVNGDETSWTVKGAAESTLDALMASGELTESIVVMPNDGGYGHGTFYANWYDGTGRFEDYILHDLIPAIDREFRTIADRTKRSVAGLSMGGYGAFVLALRNPEIFGAAASIAGALMSAAMLTPQELRSDILRIMGPVHGPYAKQLDVHVLAAQRIREELRPALHFNCGREDFLFPANQAFQELLNQLGYEHEYMEFEGSHQWSYFGEHLPDALRFLERSLHR